MSKIITIVNGKEMSKEEASAYFAEREKQSAADLKKDPSAFANALNRVDQLYGELDMMQCGVPKHQVAQHREYIRKMGLAGVTVTPRGRIIFAGPKNKEAYLAARNMGELSGPENLRPKTQSRRKKNASGSSNSGRRGRRGRKS